MCDLLAGYAKSITSKQNDSHHTMTVDFVAIFFPAVQQHSNY